MSRGLEAAYRDPLCRFYTESTVSSVLVGLLSDRVPRRVLDLASGAGSLAEAASRRWTAGELVTVDIDPSRSQSSSFARRRHFIADALDPSLPSVVGAHHEGFDLTLCNPPFRMPEWRSGFERILEDAGLADAFSHRMHIGTEALFVAQNIRLTREGGEIGLIVPDGLITGRRAEGFRAAILASHDVRTVVQLPSQAFRRTDARAFILIVRKGVPTRGKVELRALGPDGALSRSIWIDKVAAERRMDFNFHQTAKRYVGPTLRDLGAIVSRGTLEAAFTRVGTLPVFHTTDFPPSDARTHHVLSGPDDFEPPDRLITAGPGDILVARVHRSLHEKVCGVSAGRAALTSCVFRLRIPSKDRDRVLSALLSEAGAESLASTARGVGPRMLAKVDLLGMPLPW